MSETIFYTSPVGVLQITNTGHAISKVHFVKPEKIVAGAEPAIAFAKPSTGVLQECVQQLDAYFAGNLKQFDLPLMQFGSDFQQSVWKELFNIPYAQTCSYMTLSKRLGNVKAIRAVANANGKNDIAIIVPCHRVIGSDGSLVGYAGELWRKKWLLEHEAKNGGGVQLLF